MRVCQIHTTVSEDKSVTLKNVPFQPGEHVEVVVCSEDVKRRGGSDPYPLRGKPVQYLDPFEGIAEDNWEATQ